MPIRLQRVIRQIAFGSLAVATAIAIISPALAKRVSENRMQDADAWAEKSLKTLQMSCDSDLPNFKKNLRASRDEGGDRLARFSGAELVKRESEEGQGRPSPFMEMARELWAYRLPQDYPERKIFVECSLDFRKLLDESTEKNLRNWKDCLDDGYRDTMPVLSAQMYECFKKVIAAKL